MLNEVFCYIVSKLGEFQNLRHYAPRSTKEVETLVTSEFPTVPSTKHHIELPKTSYGHTSPSTLWPFGLN